jgi:uncharacterized protein YcaQ
VPAHRLTREEARRVAIGAQRLDADRPTALVPLVEQLTFLQIDPTAAIAPSAGLVAWSRLGAAYEPEQLRRALEEDRTLFELNALIRPMSDLPVYLASMANARGGSEGARQWLERHDRFRRDVLAVLRDRGPVQSRDIPDTRVVPWSSTGWTANRNVTQMLELMAMRGEVAIAGRRGTPASVGSRRVRLPAGRRGHPARGGAPDSRRPAPARARDRTREGARPAHGARPRRRRR